jgi:hypothetical protein
MFYSSYLINKLYDFTKKWLFFLENNGLKGFIEHQKKSNYFAEIFTEISHWKRGFRKLEEMKNLQKLLVDTFKSISFCQQLFTEMGLFIGQTPNQQNKLAGLSKFKKKPIDSIKEIENNFFKRKKEKMQENNVFITFTNLDETNKNENNLVDSVSPEEKDLKENKKESSGDKIEKIKNSLTPLNTNNLKSNEKYYVCNFNNKKCKEIWLNSNSTEEERMSYEMYHLKNPRYSKVNFKTSITYRTLP